MSDTAVVEALQQSTETMLGEINTTMPGVLVSFDPKRNRAVVRPSLPKRLADGTELAAPNVHEVPVHWPTGGGATFTFPLQPGDGVTLHTSQRSLEGWLGGSDGAPDDPRRFDLSDVIAVPGLSANRPAVDPSAVVLSLGDTAFRIEPGGVLRMKGSKLIVEAEVEITGGVVVRDDVVASGISHVKHVHLGRAGSDRISPPVT